MKPALMTLFGAPLGTVVLLPVMARRKGNAPAPRDRPPARRRGWHTHRPVVICEAGADAIGRLAESGGTGARSVNLA